MRFCLLLAVLAALAATVASPQSQTLRGTLRQDHPGSPRLETADRKLIALEGDESTRKVLADRRLAGFEIEARGRFTAQDRFLIDPIHTRPLQVRKDGRLKYISYWCDVCSIRNYVPGPCMCCQEETTLELRDREEK